MCEKHKKAMVGVCGELRCGECYVETELMGKFPAPPKFDPADQALGTHFKADRKRPK